MSLEIKQQEHGSQRLLTLIGRLDTETSADFELAAYDLFEAGAREFVVDLGAISYVSSAGLRVLLALAKKVDGKGSLKLVGLKGVVKEVFEKSGFARLFAIFPDAAAALGGSSGVANMGAAAPVRAQGNDVASAAANLLGVNPGGNKSAGQPAPSPNAAASTAPPLGFFAKFMRMLGLGPK